LTITEPRELGTKGVRSPRQDVCSAKIGVFMAETDPLKWTVDWGTVTLVPSICSSIESFGGDYGHDYRTTRSCGWQRVGRRAA
jgi:hypothetical protein